jgi:hypothetical protein
MSRFFNGGTAADRITFGSGLQTTGQGPITLAFLARATASGFTGWMLQGVGGGFAKFGELVSSNALFFENDFGSGGPAVTLNDWAWYVGTKASGSVLPRWHVKNITAGSAWVHSNGSANVNDLSGTVDSIIVGGQVGGGASTTWRGQVAACATWNTVLSDLAIEAACTLSAADLAAASPKWGVLLNQSSVATSVTDFTGGGGDQTSISGTAVDASEPPGWSYSLSPTATPNGIAVPVNLGNPTVNLVSSSPSGLAVPVAMGNPTVALGLSAAPSGLAIPVALGQPTVGLTGASPSGLAIPLATGQPTVAVGRVASPVGLAIPVALGQPSTVPPDVTDGRGPVLVASNRAAALVATTSARRLTQ